MAITQQELVIEPFDKRLIQPNSYDVRLSRHFSWHDEMRGRPWIERIIDPYDPQTVLESTRRVELESIVIKPGEFVLGATFEKFKLPDSIVAQLTGKSSLARLGIAVHVTAGYVDAGFSDPPASITLEIKNLGNRPVRLWAEMAVAQMIFTRTAPCAEPYNMKKSAKYNGQTEAAHSKYYLNKKVPHDLGS